MNETVLDQQAHLSMESTLRDELSLGDVALGTVAPILGHLALSAETSLFSDEIVASIRGMAASIAAEMLTAEVRFSKAALDVTLDQRKAPLANALLTNPDFLSHCHALTVERIFADRLHDRNAIDLVLSPILQSLISSDDSDVSSTAMTALTAQARFIQQQRRMELPLSELPSGLFEAALTLWSAEADAANVDAITQAVADMRAGYDESATRLALLARLVSDLGKDAKSALSVGHAGAAIFLSALAQLSQQPRGTAVLSTNERQLSRLALALRASGLKPEEVEEQFLYIHPEIALPDGFEGLRVDRAAEMLAASAIGSVGSA